MNRYVHDREWGPVMGKKGDNFFIFVLQEIKWKPRKWGICDHWRLKLFVILRLDRHLNISYHTQYTQTLELETLVMFRKERVIFSASFKTELFWTITKWTPLLPGRRLFIWPWILTKPSHGLPWWRSGWESACQCRGHGFEPWSGRIPHAAEQLGPCATTTEPARLELVLRNKRGRDSERPAHQDEEWPPLAVTRESPRTAMKTQHSQKINK